MRLLQNFVSEIGKEIGYPFYVYADGRCLKTPVSCDGKDIAIMKVYEPFKDGVENISFQQQANEPYAFDIWNIEGISLSDFLKKRGEAYSQAVLLSQNDRKELFENGDGETLKLLLDKFVLADLFAEILLKRGLERLVCYYLEKHGYAQNLENSITAYGSAKLNMQIVAEARFSKDALKKLIERGFDGIILMYLRKKEDMCMSKGNSRFVALDEESEIEFVKFAQKSSLKTYIQHYGLADTSVKALLERDDVELMQLYIQKLNEDFFGVMDEKLNTLNSVELKELYKKMFN